MTAENPTGPAATTTHCRASMDAPCMIEARLRESLHGDNLRLATVLHEDLGNHLIGAQLCLAAVRSRVAALDTALAGQLDEIGQLVGQAAERSRAVACSASAFVAAHHGLGRALEMRFRALAVPDGPACELQVEADADHGLSAAEHAALLQIAEQVVAQVLREGSAGVSVTLRRSRLGSVELSVSGVGEARVTTEVAASFRVLATVRQLAAGIDARVSVRRLADGSLFVRCSTRWPEGDTGRWTSPR